MDHALQFVLFPLLSPRTVHYRVSFTTLTFFRVQAGCLLECPTIWTELFPWVKIPSQSLPGTLCHL